METWFDLWLLNLLICLLLCCLNTSILAGLKEVICQINQQDLYDLERLFRFFVLKEQFIYTIEGMKPVSLSGDFTITPWQNILSGSKAGACFWRQWNVWKKYSHLFPMKNFILIDEQSCNFPNIRFVFLINKKCFLEQTYRYLTTFRNVLGYEVTPEKLLDQIEKRNSSFQSLIGNSEILLGILLGYGEHNARLFERRDELSRFSGRSKLLLRNPLPSKNFKSIEDEIQFLDNQLQCFDNRLNRLSIFYPVQFAADQNHIETKFLKNKYDHAKQKISNHYKDGFSLEKTLHQLMQ